MEMRNLNNMNNFSALSAGLTNANYNPTGHVDFLVIDDPQVNTQQRMKSEDDLRAELRRARRRLLADVAGEFANSHDDLLKKLAG
jgi:hypothetical protein